MYYFSGSVYGGLQLFSSPIVVGFLNFFLFTARSSFIIHHSIWSARRVGDSNIQSCYILIKELIYLLLVFVWFLRANGVTYLAVAVYYYGAYFCLQLAMQCLEWQEASSCWSWLEYLLVNKTFYYSCD